MPGAKIIDEAAAIQHAVQIAVKPEVLCSLVATAGFRQWRATDVTEAAGAVELAFFNRTTVYRLRRQIDRPPAEVEWHCETGQGLERDSDSVPAGAGRVRHSVAI